MTEIFTRKAFIQQRNAAICAAYASGEPVQTIAARHEVGAQVVYIIASSLGISRPPQPRKFRPQRQPLNVERNAAMREAYESGRSLESVGQEFGITRERVRQLLVKSGLLDRHNGSEMPWRKEILQRKADKEAKSAARKAFRKERNDKICALYKEGKTYREITEFFGLGKGFISQIEKVVRDAGMMDRRPALIGEVKHKLTDENKIDIAKRYADGGNVIAMAKEFNVTPSHIINTATAMGARRPPRESKIRIAPSGNPRVRIEVPLDTLRHLAARGLSGGQIALEVGLSRSAVIARLSRAHIPLARSKHMVSTP